MAKINLLVSLVVLLCLSSCLCKYRSSKDQQNSQKAKMFSSQKIQGKNDLAGSSYNGYVLATSWAKTTCNIKTCNPNLNIPDNVFNLHGLWPTDLTVDESPADCYSSTLNLQYLSADVQNLVKTYWNSLYGAMQGFVGHEWSKHGTCMIFKQANLANVPANLRAFVQIGVSAFNQPNDIPRQESYIRMSVGLSQTYNVYNVLAAKGINPNNEIKQLQEVQAALKSYFKVNNVGVYCGKTRDGSMNLSEIRICLDNDFKPVNCPKDKVGCPSQFFYRN